MSQESVNSNEERPPKELRYTFYLRILDLLGQVFSLAIPWGSLVLIAYLMSGSISSLAGKHTFAEIGIKFLADINIAEAVAYALCGGGVFYGIKQRNLRRDTIQRLSGRIQILETQKDQNRTTSGITQRGTTRPEDQA